MKIIKILMMTTLMFAFANVHAGISKNEGISCVSKGSSVKAQFDDSRGDHSKWVKVGSKAGPSYGCMGRCGGDCGWGGTKCLDKRLHGP